MSPAPGSAALAVAGARARERRGVLAQVRTADSLAVYRGSEPLAVVMLARHGWRRTEMAMAIRREAAPHMRRLIRLAQLTLFRLAQDRLIVVSIQPSNLAGQRMAMLSGFCRARLKNPFLWVYRRE
ncbi:hypothetical protein [Mesorhizobium sp. Z1-4]|uniref:hypothetical protein n=1 Tax=Mesorhizobium sp. Z1-4 TaxID=2448478 RepID=UPI000FDB68EE|nr:hypothetical protein [Mesorhizobium sp. Z1-4]